MSNLIHLPASTIRRTRTAWERPDPDEVQVREQELRTRLHGAHRSRTTHPCLHRLFGRNRCPDYAMLDDNIMSCRPPGTDHPSLWLKDGRAVAYVSEPYGLRHTEIVEMVAFAERWGLTVEMLPWASPHYPGHTMAIIWRRAA